MTWSPNKLDHDRLRRVHHSLHAPPMPRMAETEARRSHPIARRRACQDSFREHRGKSAQTEDVVFAGFVARTGEERLPQRVMFGELAGGKGYPGGQEKDWLGASEGGYVGLGNEIRRVAKGCSEGRQMVSTGRGGSLVLHETERRRAAERHAKTAAALSTVGISKRPGRRGGASCQETEVWVWPSSS